MSGLREESVIKTVAQILKVFADNHLFEEGIELIGSWCFQLYQKHLGAPRFPLLTQDIDFLIPNPFRGKQHDDFIKQLTDLGFNCDFRRDGSLFLWNADIKIEFIIPEKGRGSDKAIFVKQLGLKAIPLRYVSLLLDHPITIEEDGIKVLVPDPARYCLHKLIIVGRRRKKDKVLKDLQQAICTAAVVAEEDIQNLFKSLPKNWQRVIVRILENAKEDLPLLAEETGKLEITLQKVYLK